MTGRGGGACVAQAASEVVVKIKPKTRSILNSSIFQFLSGGMLGGAELSFDNRPLLPC
jgi:hypothetical protein